MFSDGTRYEVYSIIYEIFMLKMFSFYLNKFLDFIFNL